MFQRTDRGAFVCIAALFVFASISDAQQKTSMTSVRTEMKNGKGEMVGSVALTDTEAGVRISGQLKNLSAGVHGIHFHQLGKCDAPDFKSSGEHFNPGNKQHGELNPNGPHAGDLGNVTVGSDGSVSLAWTTQKVTCYIEIVPTNTVKYQIDKGSGYLQVDRPQQFSNVCPKLYGFVPQT